MLKAQIIGHLGSDAIVKQVGDKPVINFSVAHSEKGKDGKKTVWVDCAYWTDKHGIVPFLKKGTLVYVEGRPSARAYSNNQGELIASLSLSVTSVELLGSGGSQDQAQPQAQPKPQPVQQEPDDLPF